MKKGIGLPAIAALMLVIATVGVLVLVEKTPVKPGGEVVTPTPQQAPGGEVVTPTPQQAPGDLKSFKSFEEVTAFLESAGAGRGGFYRGGIFAEVASAPLKASSADAGAPVPQATAAPIDYSTTNVQVGGVDEADFFKNDGTHLYTITQGKIVILRAYPPGEAKVVSTIGDANYEQVFVNGDKLVAFGSENFDWEPIVRPLEKAGGSKEKVEAAAGEKISFSAVIAPPYYYPRTASFVKVFDVSDRSGPKLLKKIDFRGNYFASRMIGDRVYAVYSEYAQAVLPMPVYRVDGQVKSVAPNEISYFDHPFDNYQFTTVVGIDLSDLNKEETRKIVLIGAGNNIFVSRDNAYITYARYNYYAPVWKAYEQVLKEKFSPEMLEKLKAIDDSDASEWRKDNLRVKAAREFLETLDEKQRAELYGEIYEKENELRGEQHRQRESTVIHKFSLGEEIKYAAKGEVPGRVLNQFSMDEHKSFFRIATTIDQQWISPPVRILPVAQVPGRGPETPGEGETVPVEDGQTGSGVATGGEVRPPAPTPIPTPTVIPSSNNVYVLDGELKVVGKLEDLAPGESIHSARFIGDRTYLVTFKKIDPLFTIDLSDPKNPRVLGKLKIPGYSDYLHPYDETHLIGFGKDAVPAKEGDFAWYQGLKLSLFDVSDVENPRELAVFNIGDRGSESYALHDHKAFLFSRQRGLLVVPVLLAEVDEAKYAGGVEQQTYGEYKFQGAYVFSVSLEKGFELRGRVSHADNESFVKAGDYYFGGGTDVKRSAYINDVLYTISEKLVKANDLQTLEEKAVVKLPFEEPKYGEVVIADTVIAR